jgi:hypothetical protein
LAQVTQAGLETAQASNKSAGKSGSSNDDDEDYDEDGKRW